MGITKGIFINEDDSQPRTEWVVILSVMLHLLVFSCVFSVTPKSSLKVASAPIYTVNLVSFPREKPKVVKPKKREVKKTVAVKKESKKNKVKLSKKKPKIKKEARKPKKVLKSKKIPKSKNAVVKKKKAPKAPKAPDPWQKVTSAIEEIRKKAADSQRNRGNNYPGAGRGAGKTIPSGVTALKLKIYHASIGEKIKKAWILPAMVSREEDLETVVSIKVKRNGDIVGISYEEKSKNHHFDESVLRAIKKANPLPPIPREYRGDILEVGVRFHIRDIIDSS